jgi:hypothetical protein
MLCTNTLKMRSKGVNLLINENTSSYYKSITYNEKNTGMDKTFTNLTILLTALLWAAGAQAIPSLQLGGDTSTGWEYTSETWVYTGSTESFDISATANAEGESGGYAWDTLGAETQYAYLVVAAVPQLTDTSVDYFDVSVSDGDSTLTMVSSGIGSPPLEDTNSLSPHGIFDTYFEIYEFQFDVDDETMISDTQPGETGTGNGFEELLDITINSLDAAAAGVHFDLFTTTGGQWTPSLTLDPGIRMLQRRGAAGTGNKWLVNAVAPYSHDAGTCCGMNLSEPGTLGMMLIGMIGVGASRVRRRRSGK